MKLHILYFFITLTLAATSASGQGKDNGQQIIDKFFELYATQGYEPAVMYAFGTNEWIDSEGDGVKNLLFELEKNINLVGEYIDYEEIKTKAVGSRFRISSYFVYYDRQPLRFTFQLYKNKNGWIIWNFQFDTNYDDEVEEGMKLSRFGEL